MKKTRARILERPRHLNEARQNCQVSPKRNQKIHWQMSWVLKSLLGVYIYRELKWSSLALGLNWEDEEKSSYSKHEAADKKIIYQVYIINTHPNISVRCSDTDVAAKTAGKSASNETLTLWILTGVEISKDMKRSRMRTSVSSFRRDYLLIVTQHTNYSMQMRCKNCT